jgi:hypothetical protein
VTVNYLNVHYALKETRHVITTLYECNFNLIDDIQPTSKRGRKGRVEYCRPYPELSIKSTLIQPLKQNSNNDYKYQAFKDALIEFITIDIPTLPQEELLQAVDYIEQIETNMYKRGTQIPTEENLLLVYASMAYMFRNWGQFAQSNNYFEKARTLASENFDRLLESGIIATVSQIRAMNIQNIVIFVSCSPLR